jgi:hypothetical protein
MSLTHKTKSEVDDDVKNRYFALDDDVLPQTGAPPKKKESGKFNPVTQLLGSKDQS